MDWRSSQDLADAVAGRTGNSPLAQRALLHVAQVLEIIATGGRLQPTYGSGDNPALRGNLLSGEA